VKSVLPEFCRDAMGNLVNSSRTVALHGSDFSSGTSIPSSFNDLAVSSVLLILSGEKKRKRSKNETKNVNQNQNVNS